MFRFTSPTGRLSGAARSGCLRALKLVLCLAFVLAVPAARPAGAQTVPGVTPIHGIWPDSTSDAARGHSGIRVRVEGMLTWVARSASGAIDAFVQDSSAAIRLSAPSAVDSLAAGTWVNVVGYVRGAADAPVLVADSLRLVAVPAEPVAPVSLPDAAIDLDGFAGRLVRTGGYVLGQGIDTQGPYGLINRRGGALVVRPAPAERPDEDALAGFTPGAYVAVTGVLAPAGAGAAAPFQVLVPRAGDVAPAMLAPYLYPWVLLGALALFATVVLLGGRLRRRFRLAKAQRYQLLFERGAEAMVLLDQDLAVLEANAAAHRLLDQAGKRLQGKRLLSLLQTEQKVDGAALTGTMAHRGLVSFEAAVARSDGRTVNVEVRLSRMDREGQGPYFGMLYDVTYSREQFRRYEAFLERLLDGLPLEVALLTLDGKYQYLNPESVGDRGLREWLIGKTDFELCQEVGLHLEIALRRRSYRKQAIETKQLVYFDEVLPGPNGSERHYLRSYSPHVGPDGEVSVIAAFGLDVTDTRRMERELKEARTEAERMTRFKESFLQNVSHEFRTPITGIVGFAQILREEVPGPLREFIDNIERSARRLMETLNGMLDVAGLHADNLELDPQLLNLSEEVIDIARPLRRTAEEKGLFLTVRTIKPEVLVRLDQAALRRVLHNLIENAVKFTEQGGIVVEVAEHGSEAAINVMDSGVGIDRNFITSVFDEFQQENPGMDRSFEGLGVGLSVTRQLVRLMGGQIAVHSDKGQGSMFTIAFPVAFPEEASAQAHAHNVLLVDRNAEIHRVVAHMLGTRFRLHTATTLDEALARAGKTRYDVVLVDVTVDEELDGGELLQRFREVPGCEHVPIVALDEKRVPGSLNHYQRLGFDNHLAKPFEKIELLNALVDALPSPLTAAR